MSGIMSMVLGAKTAIAAAVDAYFNLVTLLLPGNGTNGAQNNTFLDSSSNNFTITRNGNTTQGTFSPFSQTGWSNFFDGSSAYLTVADNAAFEMTGDFTVECWVYPTVGSAFQYLVSKGTGADFVPFQVILDNANKPAAYLSTNGSSFAASIVGSTAATINAWNHIALVRSGSAVTLYLNGASVGTGTVSGTLHDNTRAVGIGAASDGGTKFTGYLSNVRIVKGTAVYTSAFTVPTSPLTAITNTSLLTCQSNRFVDNSSNAFAITVNGTPSVQAFSPFAPTAAYSAATNGGSAYSDGSGDYLTVASNANLTLGSSDFTIELWWYPLAFNSDGEIFTMGSTGGTNRCYAMYSSGSNGTLAAFAGQGGSSWDIVSNLSMGTAIRNAWNHMAFTRSGSTFSTYLNGSRIATTTASGTLGSSGLGIFANNSGTSQAPSGYIGGARTIKGTALYTGTTYTVPTAPFTAVTNTNLLLNFTNAGITDATAKNVLETVGNAQISTTQSKFGGSSMYFDGTGDYLVTPSSENFTLSGDFTIEGWVYRAASGNYRLFTVGDTFGTSGIEIYVSGTPTGSWVVYSNSATRITGASATRETWTHLALVRSGSTVTLYVNGTASGSTWTSSATFSGRCYVGAEFFNGSVTSDTNGYIDDFRITKFARYTTTFTPPTAAFALQ